MDKKQASVTLLPVLPLRDVVVYPNMVIPLFVGRERSMKALELAMEGPDKQIVLLAQRSPDIDDPQTEDLYEIGTVATVIQLLKLPVPLLAPKALPVLPNKTSPLSAIPVGLCKK